MTRLLLTAALAAVLTALGAGTAAAIPTTCNPQTQFCEPQSRTEAANRKLTVQTPVGRVTSQPTGIDCAGSTCSTTVRVTRECVDDSCNPWPQQTAFTLTATGGPAGYSPRWSDCTGHGTCTVWLGDPDLGGADETVTLSWVDTTAPSVTFAPPAKVGPSGFSVSAGSSDNSGQATGFAWTVDGVAQAASGSVLSLAGLAHGDHSVAVRAIDAAGNQSAVVTRTVAVDKVAGVTATAPPALTNAATVPLAFAKDADVVKSECSLDGGPWAACASGWSGIAAGTADGAHTYRVRVTDDVGNVGESPLLTTVVDRTQPVLAFTDGPAEGQQVVTRTVAITFSLAEQRPGTVTCRLDGGPATPCAPGVPVELAGLADGTHVLAVHAVDAAGNARTLQRTFGVQGPVEAGDPDGDGGVAPGDEGTPPGDQGTPLPAKPPVGRPAPFGPRTDYDYDYLGKVTTFKVLALKSLPKTAKVTVTCKGGGCKGKRRALGHRGGSLDVLKALKAKRLRLRSGAKLTITVSGEGGAKLIATFAIRAGARAVVTHRCAKAGAKLRAC